MNRKILVLSTALMATMMLSLSVAPAMARPGYVTIVVKDSSGANVRGIWVFLYPPISAVTDTVHSKSNRANIQIPSYFPAGNYQVMVSTDGGTFNGCGFIAVPSTFTGTFTVTYIP
jgi:hypothetical protein